MVSETRPPNDDNFRYVASVVASYWIVSISMVYLNKVLVTNDEFSIPAPIFVTCLQCMVTCLLCKCCGDLGVTKRKAGRTDSFFSQFPAMEYDITTAIKIMPLSLVFVAMVTFNILCLKYVEVSFYNVARSLSIVFNVVLSYVILRTTVSMPIILCLVVVFIGFFVGSDGEINFSLQGTLSGVTSSLFVSLNSIFTKKALPRVNDNQWTLTYINNANAVMMFLPLVAFLEGSIISQHLDKFWSPMFYAGMSLSGVLGFAIGIVTVMQIKVTSPLTHNISGTAKAAVQSILAFYIWGNKATIKGIAGIALVLLGSCLYSYVATKEKEREKSSMAPAPTTNGYIQLGAIKSTGTVSQV